MEDIVCRLASGTESLEAIWRSGEVALLIDPDARLIPALSPAAVVDAIIAKRNLGTHRGMAPVTIALGPGFRAGEDVDAVIETSRGHDLGRLILKGKALENTGVPGELGGQGARRVLHAPVGGFVRHVREIGDIVRTGEALLTVGGITMSAPFDGLLRGLIREGMNVPKGMKLADVDPREETDWRTISDKARCLGGAALEAFFVVRKRNN